MTADLDARERIKEQHAVMTDEGDILPDANFPPESLPMSNEDRIARMHSRIQVGEELMDRDADQSDKLPAQVRQPLSEAEQALKEALESQAEEVAELKTARELYRQELQSRGLTEERISRKLAQKFGRRIATLAQLGYDIEPIVGPEEIKTEFDQDAQASHSPVAPLSAESGEHTREPDARERAAGDY